MTKFRVLFAGVLSAALALAPMSSALAGGPHWSHGPSYHAPAFRGAYWHGGGGGGYWRGGVWWPAAAAAAVVGTAVALVAAPFVAIGNAVASATYVPPPSPAPYYAPQQFYPPQGYSAPQQYYPPQGYSAPQQYHAPSYSSAPQYDSSVPPDYHAQPAAQQYYNNALPTPTYAPQAQGYYAPPQSYNGATY